MKKLIIFLFTLALASDLINVNFFPEKTRLDILFSLDAKFSGKVIKTGKNSFLITDINADKRTEKNFNGYFLKKVVIFPGKNGILITIYPDSQYSTSVALTPDGYGLRFRIQNRVKDDVLKLNHTNPQQGLDYFTYILSIVILLIIAAALFIFKKRIVKKLPSARLNVNILFQKPLDSKNRVALIEFNKRKYLVLIGNTNILLDIFDENMVNVKTQQDFDTVLEKNIDKLDDFRQYVQNAEKLKEFDEKI